MKAYKGGVSQRMPHRTAALLFAVILGGGTTLSGQGVTAAQGQAGPGSPGYTYVLRNANAAVPGSSNTPRNTTVSILSTAPTATSSGAVADLPYLVGVADVLSVSVWHEPDLSRSVSVLPDGKISLPLVGEVQASGRSVLELQNEIRSDLAKFVKDPEVVVIVTEIRSQRINVIGQVTRAGTFSLTPSMGVLDAIALAGGLKEFAKRKQIYVLRPSESGQRERLSYRYADVLKGSASAKEIILKPRDTVVVP
ncbi:MAG: polysaccharide biosynthesis/export family protein [Granulicella sp.]